MTASDFFHNGYKAAWFGHPLPSGATESYRRGHEEGAEDRRRADLRRDGSSYRISTRACQPIGVRRERTTA